MSTPTKGTRMLIAYARVVAVALLALALAGYTGVLEIASIENFYHAALGMLFLYVGFLERERRNVRLEVSGLGVLVLVIKSLLVLVLLLGFGHLEHKLMSVVCFVVGISSLVLARYLPDG